MSLATLANTLLGLVAKLPPRAVSALVQIAELALSSDDPARYLTRLAKAQAAHAVSKQTVKAALKKSAK